VPIGNWPIGNFPALTSPAVFFSLSRPRRPVVLWDLMPNASTMNILILLAQCGVVGAWIDFRNETAFRLMAPSEIAAADPEQKAYTWGDLDRDGDIDVVCVRKQPWATTGRRTNVVFLNEGTAEGHDREGVLVDRTFEFARASTDGGGGFYDLTNDRDVALVDVDGDGWLDVVTAVTLGDGLPKRISHPRVYRNFGKIGEKWGGFVHEEKRIPLLQTTPGGPSGAPRFSAIAVGDVTGDGSPDLYFANDDAGPGVLLDFNDRLLVNDGDGSFTDSFASRGSAVALQSTRSHTAFLADMNGDDLLDLIKSEADSSHGAGIWITYNDAKDPGHLSRSVRVHESSALALSVGDLNEDGRPDLVVTEAGYDRYLINFGNDASSAATFRTGILFSEVYPDEGAGGESLIVDLDHDGRNDVIVTDVDPEFPGCYRRTHVFRNLGGRPMVTFQEQEGLSWLPDGVHDVAALDINGDELIDLLFGTCTGTEVWIQQPRGGPRFHYPEGIPSLLTPDQGREFTVYLSEDNGSKLEPASITLYVSRDGGVFLATELRSLGGGTFQGTIPPIGCGAALRWYVQAALPDEALATDPPDSSTGNYFTARSGTQPQLITQADFEGDILGWSIENSPSLQRGAWERGDPHETRLLERYVAPPQDATRGPEANLAFITENGSAGADPAVTDVDGGPTRLGSPPFNLSDQDATISYSYWFFCDDAGTAEGDVLEVEISNDDGHSWRTVSRWSSSGGNWKAASFRVGDFLEPTNAVRVRFSVADNPNNSITEAGLDDFQVLLWPCDSERIGILDSDPPDGAVDARQPTSITSEMPIGWDSVVISFSQALGNVSVDDFTIDVAGGTGSSPVLAGMKRVDDDTVALILTAPIEAGAWTKFTYLAVPISVALGYLPGDVDGNGVSTTSDVQVLVRALTGEGPALGIWSTDIDRSGRPGPADLTRQIDLLNGAGAFEAWNGRHLP